MPCEPSGLFHNSALTTCWPAKAGVARADTNTPASRVEEFNSLTMRGVLSAGCADAIIGFAPRSITRGLRAVRRARIDPPQRVGRSQATQRQARVSSSPALAIISAG